MSLKPTLFIAVLMVLGCSSVSAAWPDRPLKFVVPFSAGAMGDTLARTVGQELQQSLGQPVIVENKPGAGGNIGSSAVARSASDGYTWLVGATNNFVINQFVFRNIGFDPLKSFTPVTMLVDVPSVLLSSAPTPVRTFAELVTYARGNPGKLNYGSPGNVTTPHLWLDEISKTHDMKMTHVPYQGASQVVQALMADEVQVGLFGAGLALAQVRAGKINALAVSSDERLDVLPHTPTFAEAGLGKVEGGNWWALAAPIGTPPAIVSRLAEEVRRILATPAMQTRLTELGVVAAAQGPSSLEGRWQQDLVRWKRRIEASGVKID